MTRDSRKGDGRTAIVLAIAMFAVFNANGREIASYDSQPTTLAARELLLRGSLSLGHVVGARPQLAERPGFQLARDGLYRSAYSPVPAISAAILVWPVSATGLLDLRAPLAPPIMSAFASSVLVALAVAMVYLTARRRLTRTRSIVLAVSLGLGTGWWSTASQTLWQHETAIFGLTLAVWGLFGVAPRADDARASGDRNQYVNAALIGLGLGLAAGSRLQLAPTTLILIVAVVLGSGWRMGFVTAATAAAIVAPVCLANLRWFGSILGAAPMLEALHSSVHATTGSFSLRSGGLHGLLISPNRGLLIFSPVVALALAGVPGLLKSGWRSPLLLCTTAAAVQYLLYGSYAVWWGGHTFGPRYALDILPLLVPLGMVAMGRIEGRLLRAGASLLLAWSIGVAALGAFVYPSERWNTDPLDVDRHHERLWDWSDTQIARCWTTGPSPQNFRFFSRGAWRAPRS